MEENRINYVLKTLRVFISYDSGDTSLARNLKHSLEDYGLEVFLAHEDIAPGLEWEDVILDAIKRTDVFLPLLTEKYPMSQYTDQETGAALATEKTIIPISLGSIPYGFIKRYQALRFKENVDEEYFALKSAEEIIKIIQQNKILKERANDSLVKAIIESGSFTACTRRYKFLPPLSELSSGQLISLTEGCIKNNQVHEAYYGKILLKKILEEYKQILPQDLSKEIKTKIE